MMSLQIITFSHRNLRNSHRTKHPTLIYRECSGFYNRLKNPDVIFLGELIA